MKKRISITLSFAVLIICLMLSVSAYAEEKINIDSSNTVITLSSDNYNYSAQAIEPNISSVVYTDTEGVSVTLVKDTDYTAEYINNINVGTGTVKISGIGDYEGTLSKTFTIKPLSITDASVSVKLSYVSIKYNGKALCPNITVTLNNGTKSVVLSKGADYNVSVSNNINVGNASIKINGINNFTGTYTTSFRIIPADVTGLSYTTSNANTITLKWNKASGGITGYHLQYYNRTTKSYQTLKVLPANTTTLTLTNARPATGYWYKIRAYKTINGSTNYFGSFSNIITAISQPSKVNIRNAYMDGTTITVNWYATNCTHYQVFYSTDSTYRTNCKIINVGGNSSTTSYRITNVDRNKKYYVKVRAVYMLGVERQCGYSSNTLTAVASYNHLYCSYTTNYVNNANRTTNLRIASNAINGTIVLPGETFSFNNVVGPRTSAKGYKPAPVFVGNKKVENEVGGGICQVASTMFNCVLYGNLGVAERHQHSQRVTYVALGRDAAIYSTYEDFKWKNTTNHPIKIVMTVNNGRICCAFYTVQSVYPPTVTLKVSQSGNNFTMRRYVNGTVNYTCTSKY